MYYILYASEDNDFGDGGIHLIKEDENQSESCMGTLNL